MERCCHSVALRQHHYLGHLVLTVSPASIDESISGKRVVADLHISYFG